VKRRLFNALAGISLVLCLATAVLWVRSHFLIDEILWYSSKRDVIVNGFPLLLVTSEHGELFFMSTASDVLDDSGRIFIYRNDTAWPPGKDRRCWERLGFSKYAGWSAGYWTEYIGFPHFLAIAGTAVLPALWIRSRVRHSVSKGTIACPTCGYDLRATPDRCPECGEVPKNTEAKV